MVILGGKRKLSPILKGWLEHVKKVSQQQKISYKEAMQKAKTGKYGQQWKHIKSSIMGRKKTHKGGDAAQADDYFQNAAQAPNTPYQNDYGQEMNPGDDGGETEINAERNAEGGRRSRKRSRNRRRTQRRSRSRGRGRSRRRSSRRH